ncbi:hypothetical protein ACP_1181 [Acidobacterium capsulatum ATCC 51196]|jgi:hypothetical protein|uniref:Uncharacterized protein n=1 Tax=Acidobacterium capsulatum (strain ATCC 51196 / DSM 11244 / BCRC 80197 / JCM 7670 / NBRC 15755 / NCIMB 13165 / 161) TaxID=240015 RepID=C1F4R0_ACIC5|nr:hypothetical protein ACP_1181 [Acidobacterium capsulatum ATCC 51196]
MAVITRTPVNIPALLWISFGGGGAAYSKICP